MLVNNKALNALNDVIYYREFCGFSDGPRDDSREERSMEIRIEDLTRGAEEQRHFFKNGRDGEAFLRKDVMPSHLWGAYFEGRLAQIGPVASRFESGMIW